MNDIEISKSVRYEESAQAKALEDAGLTATVIGDGKGLVFPLPVGAIIASIVLSYDTRDGANREKVRCAVCPQHQAHNRGFRVALADGQHALVGINCGETQFGAGAWQIALADYERRVQHATYVARIDPALKAIAEISPIVMEWHTRAKDLGSWLSHFRLAFPNLSRVLTDAARRSEGRFTRERGRTRTRINRLGREESYRDAEVIEIARIPFPGMFLGRTPQAALGLAMDHLSEARRLLKGTDMRSLASAYTRLRQARQAVNDASEHHQACLRNCNVSWLAGMCDWVNREAGLMPTYCFEDQDLVARDEDGFERRFEWLAGSSIGSPSSEQISRLWPDA